ncbi:MAG: IS1595 family transposase [Blastocatellia bacterium]|nr:IS1595 family transposase [Blastocatellia bacterium]
MNIDLTDPIFNNEEAARKHFEASRWPSGPICPHCGVIGNSVELRGNSTRPGLYNCRDCDKPFTAMIGTIFERSHIPMHKWLLAMRLMSSSKKGISAHQLGRMLGFGSYRTAWFMAHRIRESMREVHPESAGPLGGEGKTVEIDETFVGGKEKNKHRNKRKHIGTGGAGKEAVFSLVERGGKVRSHHIPAVTAKNLRPIVEAQIHGATYVMTDEGAVAKNLSGGFALHGSVNHSIGEYVRGDVHTNTIEGYFSVFKRGIIGTYHHLSQQHLKRYLAEFDFRYNERAALNVTDAERAEKVLRGAVGKRMTYQEANGKGA